ncbi:MULTISPECIES: hypothetical protein [unclassified Delftia]|uniref:hypothetical protein n=1 Tax=unclassified Delftia TaxID=2613839 RepID=UPI0019017BD6|nr:MULTISPECIES: hypothetical protein [unclassified Delftia]MBK0114714.1 hypothetical protein [Delftia sp. S65]MBK0120354.1 hypothetical protein [Delftia sp. S67]MBK0133073.1 hypothetical protein [Delftia sp. S66]
MSSLDPIISADLVRARAEVAALTADLSGARSEITWIGNVLNATRSELAAARNEIAAGTASSPIKSVQRGVIVISNLSVTNTVNVGWVNLNKCVLRNLGWIGYLAQNGISASNPVMLQMLNNSQIQAEITMTYGTTGIYNGKVSWELVEYK